MFVYMYILEILNVYYTSYSETSEIVLHSGTVTNDTCISSEWVDVWKKQFSTNKLWKQMQMDWCKLSS